MLLESVSICYIGDPRDTELLEDEIKYIENEINDRPINFCSSSWIVGVPRSYCSIGLENEDVIDFPQHDPLYQSEKVMSRLI